MGASIGGIKSYIWSLDYSSYGYMINEKGFLLFIISLVVQILVKTVVIGYLDF